MKVRVSVIICVIMFFSSAFALTPKEQKWVKTLKAASIEYVSPDWFTPFQLQDAPEDISYRTDLLPEQDKNGQLYIVLPTLWLISPVILVPEDGADYAAMQAGEEIDINKYLVDGVMHYPWTPLPDQEGNIVIFWHSNFYKAKEGRYKAIFADIMNLDAIPTDEIWLYQKQSSWSYELYKYTIEQSYDTVPTDVAILEPKWGKELTVFACTNGLAWRWILRARQLPDEEILVPSSMKVRVWWLLERFSQLTPDAQQKILVRMWDALAQARSSLESTSLSLQQKMRKYLLRWIEIKLFD